MVTPHIYIYILVTRTLPVARCIATSSKKLLVASNKKLLVAMHLFLVGIVGTSLFMSGSVSLAYTATRLFVLHVSCFLTYKIKVH